MPIDITTVVIFTALFYAFVGFGLGILFGGYLKELDKEAHERNTNMPSTPKPLGIPPSQNKNHSKKKEREVFE